jgi:hypothetical protein
MVSKHERALSARRKCDLAATPNGLELSRPDTLGRASPRIYNSKQASLAPIFGRGPGSKPALSEGP